LNLNNDMFFLRVLVGYKINSVIRFEVRLVHHLLVYTVRKRDTFTSLVYETKSYSCLTEMMY